MENNIKLKVWKRGKLVPLVSRTLSQKEILEQSPEANGSGKQAFYSVGCCWWTSYPEDLGDTGKFISGDQQIVFNGHVIKVSFNGLPCCPHCGSVLMQAPLKKFVQAAIETFINAHHRNSSSCSKNWRDYEN